MNASLYRSVLLSALCLLAAACESSEQIASACRRGVCSQAIMPELAVCSANEVSADITVHLAAEVPQSRLQAICLPEPLAQAADGTVHCSVSWTIPQPPEDFDLPGIPGPHSCDDVPWLSPLPGAPANEGAIRQVSQAQRDAGEDGFYLDTEDVGECRFGNPRIRFTQGARPTHRVEVAMRCLSARALNADAGGGEVPIAECAVPARGHEARGVGDACMPRIVPERGFDPRQRAVELGSPDCASGVCLVHMLDGDPALDCVPDDTRSCPTDSEVERAVHCSCRCDAPPGQPDACDCPHGFTCLPMFQDAPATLRGGYCVRNDNTPDSFISPQPGQ